MTNELAVEGSRELVPDLVMQGLRIVKIENETQQLIAEQHPRAIAKVADNALGELEALPEFASKAFYVIPYDDGKVPVEGPSIKAAMALARNWGNCANGARVVDDQKERVIVEGVFLDYETNLRTTRQVSVSKFAWSKKQGQMIKLREDRLNMAIQAGMSKAVRNAILASMPAPLVETYHQTAKKIAASGQTRKKEPIASPKERIEKMYATFKKLGVEKEQVEAYIQEKLADQDVDEILAHMIGVYNAIDDGQVSLGEVFAQADKKSSAPAAGHMTMNDLTAKK